MRWPSLIFEYGRRSLSSLLGGPIWARAARFAVAFVTIGVALCALSPHLPLWLFVPIAFGGLYLLIGIAKFDGSWRGWIRTKWREWSTDLRQLMLWTRLAFTPGRDEHATAAMAHQHQFLSGRIMSPLNIFTMLPLLLALGGVAFGAVNGWRVDRIKDQRDAPCSARELTKDSDGEFRTTRASCAQLGATNDVARLWMIRAQEIETERDTAIARIREETAATIARQQAEAQRRQALAARQRRRENEGIEAALGGDAPDLERSLCELSGRVDCGPPTGEGGPASAPPAAVVPDPAAGADGQ